MAAPRRAILFDLDGRSLDTPPDMVGALHKLRLERRAAPLPYESVRSSVSHGAARLVKRGFPDADPETFAVLQKRSPHMYAGWGGDGVIQTPLEWVPWREHSGRL